MKRHIVVVTAAFVLLAGTASGQQISKDELIFLTSAWQGERFEDGRPRVPDDILERTSS